uniref:Transformer-2 protein homolog isoform X2 n=1 Tax=Crassostrea virginica TaxID=6565 RepID=A0A8B8BP41_CRAVI|nr:transformer-2 protein homolog isoform X2 [Crassostrea virginica]
MVRHLCVGLLLVFLVAEAAASGYYRPSGKYGYGVGKSRYGGKYGGSGSYSRDDSRDDDKDDNGDDDNDVDDDGKGGSKKSGGYYGKPSYRPYPKIRGKRSPGAFYKPRYGKGKKYNDKSIESRSKESREKGGKSDGGKSDGKSRESREKKSYKKYPSSYSKRY